MGDIAFMLHLLHDTPERLAALSSLAQSLPSSEAAAIWAGWQTHLAHEGVVFPYGTMAQDAILHILVTPITSLGKTVEIAELL